MSAPEPIGRMSVVKSLSGNRGPRSGFSDEIYTEIIGRWDGMLRSVTRKQDWEEDDPDYAAIQGIIEHYAAAEIRWMVDKKDATAAAFFKLAKEQLELLLSQSSIVGQPASNGINIPQPHQSYPANPAGEHFTGLKKNKPGTGYLINSELGIFFPDRF